MGYSEVVCQLCGVSFAIARIRRIEEPIESTWNYFGSEYVDSEVCADGSGCQMVPHEGGGPEHVAGPGCYSGQGYSAYRISVEEMNGSRAIQCILQKGDDWKPEEDDQDFELEGKYFLTGVGDGSPDESAVEVNPVR